MKSIKSCTFIIDSKGNKHCFYYKSSSIIYKTLDKNALSQKSILANRVQEKFLCTISKEDVIYVLCISEAKSILLFDNQNNEWNMKEIKAKCDKSHSLIALFHLKDKIHAFYCETLPISNYYNLFHIIINESNYKEMIVCEFFSKNDNPHVSLLAFRNECIDLVSSFFNGRQIIVNHFSFDIPRENWSANKILDLETDKAQFFLLDKSRKLSLICAIYENELIHLLRFEKIYDSPFVLIDIIQLQPYFGKHLNVNNISNEYINISFIVEDILYVYSYHLKSRKWIKEKEINLINSSSLYMVELIAHKDNAVESSHNQVCNIDDKLNIVILNHISDKNKSLGDVSSSVELSVHPNSFLLKQIEELSEKLFILNQHLNNVEKVENPNVPTKEYSVYTNEKANIKCSSNISKNKLKQSDFRERFMKSKPVTLDFSNNQSLLQNAPNTLTKNTIPIINKSLDGKTFIIKPDNNGKDNIKLINKNENKKKSPLLEKINKFFNG